ncbi:MAG: prephenate dehydrogenase [Candidatus Saccharimonas sp.]
MKTVGIIGFGSFGKYLAEKLSSYARVRVYSASQRTSSWMVALEEVTEVDYLVLAIPLDAYVETLRAIKPLLKPHTVIVDVCSVKVKPIELIRSALPDQPLVATHPMFGPESASVSFDGHTLVMCPEVSTTEPYGIISQFAASLGLRVIEMTADEHDREIAVVQGLTFFIARALNGVGVHDQKLFTPSFERLLKLAELERHHSLELFKTIQEGNPHTKAVRQNFMLVMGDIDHDLAG